MPRQEPVPAAGGGLGLALGLVLGLGLALRLALLTTTTDGRFRVIVRVGLAIAAWGHQEWQCEHGATRNGNVSMGSTGMAM